MTNRKRYILHIDGDAFFASCEVARRPDLKGKPVVVGQERGIASAYTYEAKRLGISRGMPIFQIRREYPNVTILSSHFELYQEYHNNAVRILERYLPVVESYSIDECFAVLPEMDDAVIEGFVSTIKNEITRSLGVTFSFGIAHTKTLAKTASKRNKPDGLTIVLTEVDRIQLLKDTKIESVWGIGWKTQARLTARGIRTAYDFICMKREVVAYHFSEPILNIWLELQGESIRSVSDTHTDKKSIQATRMLVQATTNATKLYSELSRNIEIACEELRALGLCTNAVSFFYRLADGKKERLYGSAKLPVFTQDPAVITKAIALELKSIYQPGCRYKATGIGVFNLRRRETIQNDLFGIQKADLEDKRYLEAMDRINRKFGAWSVMRAASLNSIREREQDHSERSRHDTYEYGLPLPFMGDVF